MKKITSVIAFGMLFFSGTLFGFAETTSTNSNCVVLTTDMGFGATDASTGGQVTKLQTFLASRGFLAVKKGAALGTFGPQTKNAVMSFQKNYGIIQSGYVGPLTRSNIQTISCAVGGVDTSNLPGTVVASGSLPLLTFSSPSSGALIIKGEKDLDIDWTLASGVIDTFANTNTRIMLDLVASNGEVMSSIGNGVRLSQKGQGNRVENDFKKAIKGRRDEVIPSGQYKLKATLRYTPLSSSTEALALITKASSYASESGWFSIVDPAPKPVIKLTASTTTIPTSQPVTLTWSATSSSTNCILTDVAASTTQSVGVSGSKVVTPTTTSTYKLSCELTSVWPFPGMSYTTSAQKGVTITVGTATTQTPTPTNPTPSGTFHNFLASSKDACETLIKNKFGSLVGTCSIGGGCTLNGQVPTSSNPSANPTLWGACISSPVSSQTPTTSSVPSTSTKQTTVKLSKPTITIKANGSRVRENQTIRSNNGTITFEWSSTGATECMLNGTTFETSGSKTYSGLTSTDYVFSCSNDAGTTSLKFSVAVSSVLGVATTCADLLYNLHRGHESEAVTRLQAFLSSLGLLDEVTGFYGDKTIEAVRSYQERNGLPVTGMVYERTRALMKGEGCD